MKKKVKNFLFKLVIFSIIFQPVFVKADASKSVAYLQSLNQDPWITQGLVAAGASNVPVDYLKEVSGTLSTDYAKAILALASAGKNPKTFGNIDYVAKLKTYYNNNQIGDINFLNDDMWSILALSSAGEAGSSESTAAKNYLLAHQNSDGGWGYAVDGVSDTNDTAVAIMALVEAGLSSDNSAITKAVSYIKLAQNDDGGFGWMVGSSSDSGSDAWVSSAVYKIGQNPANWAKNNNNPISHLESLKDTDGGFWWVAPGSSEFNNKAMTAYAVIALSGKSYPVDYYQGQNSPNPGTFHLRIEGQNNNICDTYAAGDTAIDVLKNAAAACNYTYEISESSFGSYLSKINNEAGAGMSGWMYFVNNISPLVGASDYKLKEGDEVLWYFGEWGWQPTKLSVSKNSINQGDNLEVLVEYFNGQSWNALDSASVKTGNQTYTTNNAGKINIVLASGNYGFYAEKSGFVRSNKKNVSVGQNGVSQTIGLIAEIEQAEHIEVDGEAIIFEINPSQLNFGKLSPGETGAQKINIINSGTVNLEITANISGDNLFKENLKLNSGLYSEFNADLIPDQKKEVEVKLSIPNNYLDSGTKTGELIFWAK